MPGFLPCLSPELASDSTLKRPNLSLGSLQIFPFFATWLCENLLSKEKKIKEYIFIHYSYWVLPEETGCLEFTSTFDPERSSLTTELVIPYPFVRKATRNSMGECTLHILPQKYSQARLEVLTNIPILKVRKQSSERIDALTKVHTARKW